MSVSDGADFSSYLVARWPALVRTLVLLGCDLDQAEDLAEEGLARCYSSWDRIREADDVDAHVYRTVLERWERRHGRDQADRPLAARPELPVLDPTLPDPEQRVELLRSLEAALDALPDELRTVLVLRFVADLNSLQVADVLGVPVGVVDERQAAGLAGIDLQLLWEETR